MQKSTITTKQLGVTAVLLALAVVTDFIAPVRLPYGGSLSFCTMLFICLIGYFYGVKIGVMAGVAFGLLQLMLGGYVVHPIQALLDYPLAFGALGISGFFRTRKYGLTIGYIVAVGARYLFAVLSGVVFFAAYAPPGSPVLWYSVTYNLTYILPEMILSLIIISVPAIKHVVDKMKQQTLYQA